MNFEHHEDRRMLADALQRFLGEQHGFEQRNRIAYGPTGTSRALWQQLAEIGALGALFTEEEGGLGGGGFDIMVVFEALGRSLVVEPFLGTLMAGRALAAAGDAAQQQRWLAPLVAGESIGLLAHDEADAHHVPAHVDTRAQATDGGWVLDGRKVAVPQGEAADFYVISARVAGAVGDEAGLALFVVPRAAAGLDVQGFPAIDGGRVADIVLDAVRVDAAARLGAGEGWPALECALDAGILAVCAEAMGAIDVAKASTLDYLRTRRQFGTPISSFQALQHRMADLAIDIEQARSAVINAAAALALEATARARAMAAAKVTIGRIATRVAEESIQMHGGIGMTWELPLAHVAKRLVMIDHQLGDKDHHLARYVALMQQV